MNITPPTPEVTQGPEWAQDINTILTTTIAEHNHQSPNGGVPLTQDALAIDGNLSLNGNQLTNVNAVGLETLNAPASGSNRLYNDSGDLYYTDGNGTNVRITENGSLSAASFGGISGLSGTQGSATFAGLSTFVWKKEATEYATMENGPVKIYSGNDAAPTSGITLVGKDGLASDVTCSLSPFNTVLPQDLPVTQSFITLTTTGEQTASVSFNKGITKGMVQSGSTGTSQLAAWVQTTPTTWQNSGLEVTLTTTGNPVLLSLQGYQSSNGGGAAPAIPAGCIRVEGTAASTITKYFVRFSKTSGSTTFFGDTEFYTNTIVNQDAGGYYTYDFPLNITYLVTTLAAGTHTFRVQGQLSDNAANATWYWVGFAATEL